ncbi:MAG: 16S rRNA (cytosine(967)-C(5))-methyltransferase RsmB [Verrucomicrobia bacterium]|nr:16S rRNA (cytosine(967)-C(5))-methyltransferase RsmB [Verrucomicrobiota bacterium]
MQKRPENSRLSAARILADWLDTGAYPDRSLERISSDRAFVTEVVYGVVRWHGALTWLIDNMTGRKPHPGLFAVLEVGLYQVLFMDNVEEYAAVNETVEAAKTLAAPGEANMVNAILRRILREKSTIMRELDRAPLCIRLSHPDLLFNRWKREFGERNCRKLFEWNNKPADTVVRVLRERMRPDAFRREAEAAGIQTEPHPHSDRDTFIVSRGVAVPDLPGFAEGAFYAQDPSTLASVVLLKPQPGERILDACAAPGGKTVAIAERMKSDGCLIALDLHDDRLTRLNDNLKRMKFDDFVQVHRGNAGHWKPEDGEGFDAILLDVPCSNTGVIRRRPDVKWGFTLGRLRSLVDKQTEILDHCSTLLKTGGRLVYSTCSLEPEEDESFIQAWLEKNPGFHFVKAEKLFPPKTQTDGAYAALLTKKG